VPSARHPLDDFELPGVFNDVSDRRLESDPRLQLQHTLVLQQQKNAAAIGRIVGNRQRPALRDSIPALMFLGIDPHRKIDSQANRFDLVPAIFLLIVEIGLILKGIRLQVT
jgi:hypothetical protein